MEIILISGGLGGQMFQYAFSLAKTKNNPNITITDSYYDIVYGHNGYELKRVFGIPAKRSNCFYNILYRISNKLDIFRNQTGHKKIFNFFNIFNWGFLMIFFEKQIGVYDAEALKKRKGVCFFWGYWLSEKYFSLIKNEITNSFTFNENLLSLKTEAVYNLIKDTNSVSIHIRRGDYLSSANKDYVGNICDIRYYTKAIKKIEEEVSSPTFFIFSNDIKWVKKNLQIPDSYYIDWNEKEDSWQDMFLMSKCKHNIIANSTFSWWGAWLNQNTQKIVISPDHFYNGIDAPDLIPDSWIKIKTG